MNNTYFWADTHFNHYNIMKYCNRPFKTVEEMNEFYIEQWNSTVKSNDRIYFLGDFAFKNARKIFESLNGKKYLIIGNHDRKEVLNLPWIFRKGSTGLRIGDDYIWLSHYPHRSWDRSYHGSFHLYGHVHGVLPTYGKSMDVGVDNLDKPISFEEIKDIMRDLPLIGV